MNSLGRHVYGLAALWLGVVGLLFGDFATYWQPYPDELPGKTALAYLAAAVLVIAGAAIQRRSTFRWGGAAAATLFVLFALLWSRRVIHYPQIFGTWSGCAEEVAQAIGGILVFVAAHDAAGRDERAQAWCVVAFGVCAISFGIVHFEALPQTASMVPTWLPGGGAFWAKATGVFHVAGGVALVIGFQERLAARLLTIMYAGFSVLIWLPRLPFEPGDHIAWAGNGVNLALVGAAWLVADHATSRRALPALGAMRPGRASDAPRAEANPR